jgi:3-deoxy-manno-octulosonate cytidylyltransferase (CMP-KDO synthetase)
MSKIIAIIPARLAATRLPNKPLIDICGKTMIQRVYEQAKLATQLADVWVATPDEAIAEAVRAFGGTVVMTRSDHPSGTDRLAEAALHLPPDVSIIVNVQGDEPLIDPATIDAVAMPLQTDRSLAMTTLSCPLPVGRENDPNAVKVVCDIHGNALYFSRSPLPYRRDGKIPYAPQLHVGLYAYRRDFLALYPTLTPTPLSQIESLEQLRVLEHGYKIRVVQGTDAPESVDTPEDLERVRQLFMRVL